MDTLVIFFIANTTVWLGIVGYLAFLAKQQRQLGLRLTYLEMGRHSYEKEQI